MHGRWELGVAADVMDRPAIAETFSLSHIYHRNQHELPRRSTTGWRVPFRSAVGDFELHPDALSGAFGIDTDGGWSAPRTPGAQTRGGDDILGLDERGLGLPRLEGRGSRVRKDDEGEGELRVAGGKGASLHLRTIQNRMVGPARVSAMISHLADFEPKPSRRGNV